MKLARAILSLAVVIFLLASANPLALHTAGFAPKTGDSFHYYEVQTTGNGTGYYAGYTDQTILNGVEQITGVNGDNVSASYNYSYNFTSNEASSTSGSQSGVFSFDSSSFLYGSQTDGQVGYVNPTVWFAMNNNLSVGSTFNILNTQMTISSKNFSLFVPTLSEDISTISGVGSGSYTGSPGNDEGGIYNVTYVWNVYFDPNSGYIVGYNYFESDTNSSATFTWSDNLYVTQTTYPLTVLAVVTTTTAPISTSAAVSSSTSNASAGITPYLGYIAAFIILILIIAIIAFAASRRNRRTLPSHPYRQTPPPSAPPPGIDLTPKEQPPVQQVVIKEVAKVQCQYCLPPNQEIITSAGIKSIESVEAGDLVLTHSGKYHKVTQKFQREYEGDLVGIRTWSSYVKTWSTPEHPFLTAKHMNIGPGLRSILTQVQWTHAHALEEGDFLCLPRVQETSIPESVSNSFQYHQHFTKEENLPLTNGFLIIAGWYLAEGWFSPKSREVVFTLGKSIFEYQRAFELKSTLERIGISTALLITRNGVRVSAYSMKLGRILVKHFGSGATEKKIPNWVLQLPTEKCDILLRAYLEGDGNKVREDKFRATTVSRQLAHDLQLLGTKCGYMTSLRIKRKGGLGTILGRQVSLNQMYHIDFVVYSGQRKRRGSLDGQFAYYRIRTIEYVHYKGAVYNLQVEDDNSFCTLAHTVHNCGALMDSTATVCPRCGAPRT